MPTRSSDSSSEVLRRSCLSRHFDIARMRFDATASTVKAHHPAGVPTRQPESAPTVLTVKQFYEAVNRVIGINRIYELVRSGQLRTVKIGRKHLILASEVTEFFIRKAGKN